MIKSDKRNVTSAVAITLEISLTFSVNGHMPFQNPILIGHFTKLVRNPLSWIFPKTQSLAYMMCYEKFCGLQCIIGQFLNVF